MQTTLALFHNKIVCTHSKNANSLSSVLNSCDLDDLSIRFTTLLHKIRIAQLILCESLDIGNGFTSKALRQKFNLITLDVFDDKDVEAFEEVEGNIVDCVTEDRFLNEQHIAIGFFDTLAEVEDVLATLFDDFVHLAVVIDHNRVIHLRRRR